MVKIFITGCSKSGTTLLKNMFNSFERTWVVKDEVSLDDFCALKKENVGDFDFCVGKRSWATLFSTNRLTKFDIERQMFLLEKHDIRIVNIIRDGRNVVKSQLNSWGVYNPFEWMSCVDQAKLMSSRIDVNVRYENLLLTPDLVQDSIANELGLVKAHPFSDYPYFMNHDGHTATEYTPRPLDKSKIDPDTTTYLQRPNDVEYFNQLLKELNYSCAE